MLVVKGGGSSPGADRGHKENKHSLLENPVHPSVQKHRCQARIDLARCCANYWDKMTSKMDTATALVTLTRPRRSCLAWVLFASR